MLKSFPITEKCNICYETFLETPDEPVVQLICGHAFHYECIVESYKMKTDKIRECPYCRMDGGWLPEVEGFSLLKNIHQKWKSKINENKFKKINKLYKSPGESDCYNPSKMCKGFLKSNKKHIKFNGVWTLVYNKCTAPNKKGCNGYCGRHKSQCKKKLMSDELIEYLKTNKIYDVKTITSGWINTNTTPSFTVV